MVAFEQMHVVGSQWYNTLQVSRTVSARTVLFADEKPISYSLIVNSCTFACCCSHPQGKSQGALFGTKQLMVCLYNFNAPTL